MVLARDILADGVATNPELRKLQEWLMGCPATPLLAEERRVQAA